MKRATNPSRIRMRKRATITITLHASMRRMTTVAEVMSSTPTRKERRTPRPLALDRLRMSVLAREHRLPHPKLKVRRTPSVHLRKLSLVLSYGCRWTRRASRSVMRQHRPSIHLRSHKEVDCEARQHFFYGIRLFLTYHFIVSVSSASLVAHNLSLPFHLFGQCL